jgi:hypothetical protein
MSDRFYRQKPIFPILPEMLALLERRALNTLRINPMHVDANDKLRLVVEVRRVQGLNAEMLAALKAILWSQEHGHYAERQDALDAGVAVVARAEGGPA